MIQKNSPTNKLRKSFRKFKIVIDTNVWISAIFWKGIPGGILKLWRDSIEVGNDRLTIVVSREILEEIWTKLKRISSRLDWDTKELKEWLILIEEQTEFVETKEKLDVCRDKKNNKFLEAALVSRVDFIVTGDKDLLVLKKFKRIKIVTPRQFLGILLGFNKIKI